MSNTIKTSSKKTIAVITSDLSVRFYIQVVLFQGIAQYVYEHNNFIVRQIPYQSINDDTSFAKCDGIILFAGIHLGALTERLKATGLPIIDLSGEYEDDEQIISVDTDGYKMGVLAAERLLRRGFTNFGIYGCGGLRFAGHMSDGFKATLEKSGYGSSIFLRPGAAISPAEMKSHYKKLQKWVKQLPCNTAVFCHSDTMATELVNSCLKSGRAVPNDIAIIGAGNYIFDCSLSAITISTVDENLQGLGYDAMRILAHLIDHPVKPKKRPVFRVPPLGIVERESTCIYPVNPPWLAKLLLMLDDNLNRNFTVPELAKLSGVSQVTVQKAFKKAFGMSASKYMTSIKMREAKRLIGMKKFSLKEIAYRLNFSSPTYFGYAYEAFYGHPPSADLRK